MLRVRKAGRVRKARGPAGAGASAGAAGGRFWSVEGRRQCHGGEGWTKSGKEGGPISSSIAVSRSWDPKEADAGEGGSQGPPHGSAQYRRWARRPDGLACTDCSSNKMASGCPPVLAHPHLQPTARIRSSLNPSSLTARLVIPALPPGAGTHQLGPVPGPRYGHHLANRTLGSLA